MAKHVLAALVVLVALEGAPTTAGAQAEPGIDELLARVGERIADFYAKAQHVICTEVSTVQPIDLSYSSQGFARTVESELRVEADGLELLLDDCEHVAGAPREKDKKNRDGCTDPTPLSNEQLEFLLPAHRAEYQFKLAGLSKERNRPAFLIDFTSVNRRSDLELIEDPGGHDDCFDWTGDIVSRGRIWVDATGYDVLRIERSVGGPVSVRVPVRIQRRHNLDIRVVIMRDDMTIRYRSVAFSDPDETLLLPESVYSFTIVSGGLQSTRRSQVYSDYKRFVGDSRVVERD